MAYYLLCVRRIILCAFCIQKFTFGDHALDVCDGLNLLFRLLL